MGTDDAGMLDARLSELGIAATQPAIAIDATITGRRDVRSRPGDRFAAVLPRISVDERSGTGEGPADGHRADLAIDTILGEGGMGRVYLARQHSLGREVAVKMLHEAATAPMAEALLREARLTGSLEHPGVIPVHALGVDDAGRPLLVMKRVEGVAWRELLRDPDHRAWSTQSLIHSDPLGMNLTILARICQTLELAHGRGIVHRDIKPENVRLGAFGEIYLVDWGIAAAPDDPPARGIVGTPAYMAPEMVLGGGVDERTDVYLLGATLHEVLTQRYRHDGDDVRSVLRSAARSEPYAYGADVPMQLAELCNQATARDPDMRLPTARAFREAIELYLRWRSTQALAAAATRRVEALEALLSSGPPSDLADAYRLATEARFGFAQVQNEHPTSEDARRGADRCLAAMVDLELRQEHADTADALLREMHTPNPALQQRLEQTRARLAQREREAAKLRELAHDIDPSVSPRSRMLALLTLIGTTTLGALLLFRFARASGPPTHRRLLVVGIVMVLTVAIVVAVARRSMRSNAFNRRLSWLLLAMVSAALVNRTLGALAGTPIPEVLAVDLLIFGALSAAASITLLPHAWACVGCCALGIAALRLWPDHAPLVFATTIVTAMLGAVWALRRRAKA